MIIQNHSRINFLHLHNIKKVILMNYRFCFLLIIVLIQSCATKKQILYIQDAEINKEEEVKYREVTIQPNDILKISVESLVPEAAQPYNKAGSGGNNQVNAESLQLNGYLVSTDNTINFPVLGKISTKNKTTQELEVVIKNLLESGNHLINPTIDIRIINAKFVILGEVRGPGTYSFTEQSLTLFQALGYAGDLSINGKRNDITIIREVDGIRKISHVDITSTQFMNSEFYYIKPNDQIIVNPNNPRIKSAGYVGNLGTLLGLISIAFSTIIIFTR